jgi:hypothetical protein
MDQKDIQHHQHHGENMMRDLRRDSDSPTATSAIAWMVLAMAAGTFLSAVLFCACAFHLEAWGPPHLLLGTGVGLVGVLVGGVATLGGLLRLFAEQESDDEVLFVPRLFKDRLGPVIQETPDTGV